MKTSGLPPTKSSYDLAGYMILFISSEDILPLNIYAVLFNSFRNNVWTWLSSRTLLLLIERNKVFCRDWRHTTQ